MKTEDKWKRCSNQLKTIFWEHYKIRKHHFFLTFLEIVLPVVIFVFVAYGRSTLPSFVKEYLPPTYNDPVSDFTLSSTIDIRATKLYYTPYTEFTENITRKVQRKLHMYNEAIKGFDSKDDMLRYYRENGNDDITVVINFDDVGHETPANLKYNLQMYKEGVDWQTDQLYRNDIRYISGAGSDRYLLNQLLAFQWALDTSYIEIRTNSSLNISMNFQEFPYPSHWTDDAMNDTFVHLLPLLTMLCFIFLFPSILKMIVEEKASGMKQLMKINGLKSWAYWFGWFVNAYSLCCISAIVVAILLTQRIFHEEYAPLQHVETLQLAGLLLLYCSATISFILAFSTLFRNATFAMIIGITIWFLSYIVYVSAAINMEIVSLHGKYLASLLPHVALFYGFQIISVGEVRGKPVGFTELPRACNDDITMQVVFTMLILDTILFLLITIFFETDCRGKYRISKLYKTTKTKMQKISNDGVSPSETQVLINVEEDCDAQPILEIKNLTKKYGNVSAVNKLNMKIYENSLTVLLGHNGAGKTTTMSILAGLEQETSGELIMDDADSVNLKDRQLVSICPQENMLFPVLSVEEHLQFFGKLKGLTDEQIQEDVKDLLHNKLKLYEKRNELVKTLSGGMKRKLCIGIAIMGKPKLLILDEPTAGIDPEGRRDIWDMILNCKDESSIIISTHLMEEAEELADRVAIIADGSLECYGTPMFLKEAYGVGYRVQLNCGDPCKRDDITNTFKTELRTEIKPKIIEQLPLVMEYCIEKSNQDKFSRLLSRIDSVKEKLCIQNYKISSISLEDVFLKALPCYKDDDNINNNINNNNKKYSRNDSILSNKSTESEKNFGCFGNFSTKFGIIFEKKIKFFRTNIIPWIVMIVLFYSLVILTFAMSDKGYKDLGKDGKTIQLDLGLYGSSNVYYSINEKEDGLESIYKNLVKASSSTSHKTNNVSESLLERGIANIMEYRRTLVVATNMTLTSQGLLNEINVMYSNQAIHGAPISLNLVTNALLKHLTGKDDSIIASHTPLQSAHSAKHQTKLCLVDNLLLWMILFPTGCLFSVIMFIALPTLERNSMIIVLSRIHTLRPSCYWVITYLIDVLTYVVIILLPIVILGILALCGEVIQLNYVGFLVVILFWYGATMIPFTYLTSFSAKSVSTAVAKFLIPNMSLTPVLAGIAVAVEIANPTLTDNVVLYLSAVINPHVILTYSLSKLCMKMVSNHNWDILPQDEKEMICSETPLPCCDEESIECLNDRAVIENFNYYYISIAVAIIIIVFIICRDADKKLKDSGNTNSWLSAKNLQKQYTIGWPGKSIQAVKSLTFDVSEGECFGLLGVNGAGKSTSFKIITRQEKPDKGTINISTKTIGYCPQDHAMINFFTGRELLRYFGRLRNPQIANEDIDKLLEKCGLWKYRNQQCGTYSGGNKRKLNLCISLIGAPAIITLDEPTTGVDLENRNKIRDLIQQTKMTSTIIFTSHSMDECEKLCDKLAIMKAGSIVTGTNKTVEDLKKEYNVGHVIQIKVTDGKHVAGVLDSLKEKFSDLQVLENRNRLLTVCVKNSEWGIIFEKLEQLKGVQTNKHIIDYIVKNSSLEQVFLRVAKQPEEIQITSI